MKTLRSAMRRRRSAMPPAEVAALSARIARHFWDNPIVARCTRIACYVAVAGEVDCGPIMAQAHARGRSVYLPVLHGDSLVFAPWRPGTAMASNRYGIPEPAESSARWLRAAELGVVLAPLVAFDDSGRRLGMGGGFYDRTFRFLNGRGIYRRPHFVGLAYEFQRVESLPAQRWDVSLHGAFTEFGARFF